MIFITVYGTFFQYKTLYNTNFVFNLNQVSLSSNETENIDIYRLKIGVRSLQWNSKELLINDKPIYFRGFGRHEDSDASF